MKFQMFEIDQIVVEVYGWRRPSQALIESAHPLDNPSTPEVTVTPQCLTRDRRTAATLAQRLRRRQPKTVGSVRCIAQVTLDREH